MRYLVTGGTGYIGSMLVKRLRTILDAEIIILTRNENYKGEKERVRVCCMDIAHKSSVEKLCAEHIDVIFHCAAPTESLFMKSKPIETFDAIVTGTKNLLEVARECGVKRFVYLSSMEVYGQIACKEDQRVTEEELGYLDLQNPRNCYPLGKRMAEHLCYSYFVEYGVPTVVARLAQTFGRGIRKEDNRVFAQFAKAIQNGQDIVLHTDGTSMGNYCGIDDVVDALLLLASDGKSGQIYNIANESNTMMIREMAQLVVDKFTKNQCVVRIEVDKENEHGYAAATGLRMSSQKMQSLGWKPKMSLEDMFEQMMEDMG